MSRHGPVSSAYSALAGSSDCSASWRARTWIVCYRFIKILLWNCTFEFRLVTLSHHSSTAYSRTSLWKVTVNFWILIVTLFCKIVLWNYEIWWLIFASPGTCLCEMLRDECICGVFRSVDIASRQHSTGVFNHPADWLVVRVCLRGRSLFLTQIKPIADTCRRLDKRSLLNDLKTFIRHNSRKDQ